MKTTDQIQRVLELQEGLESAWHAISKPEKMSRWFSEHECFESRVGVEIVFERNDYGRKYGWIEVIEPQTFVILLWLRRYFSNVRGM